MPLLEHCAMLEHEWDLKSVDFPLTEESVVFEIGGYVGRWAKEIAERYNPELFVFEPQMWAYRKCQEALVGFSHTYVFEYGLGVDSGVYPMGNWETDGCSLINIPHNKPTGTGIVMEINSFLQSMKVERINLCLMNIEGYEFKLIPYMIETGIMDRIDYFMCQFHLASAGENEYHDLRRQISKTKKLRFDYGPVLTCWEPK
jgi:FkbM family methyltransferase